MFAANLPASVIDKYKLLRAELQGKLGKHALRKNSGLSAAFESSLMATSQYGKLQENHNALENK